MKRDYRLLKISVHLGAAALILWMITHYWPAVERFAALIVSAAAPLIAGCVIAYAVNILMTFYEKRLPRRIGKWRLEKGLRAVSLLLAVCSLMVIVALLLTIVIPELIEGVRLLAREAPPALERLIAWIVEKTTVDGESILPEGVTTWLGALSLDSDGLLQWALSQIDRIVPAVVNVVSSVFSVVVSVLLSAIFALYLLCGKEKLASQINTLMNVYLKPRRAAAIRHVLKTLNECFRSYIVGQCLEALILGALILICMLIFRVPYAVTISCMTALLALIPYVGAYLSLAIGCVLIVTISPMKALIFVIIFLVAQQVEGNLIYPRVVGKSVGLPAYVTLSAVMVGGALAGIPGMFFVIPVASVAYELLRESVQRRNATRKAERAMEEQQP